MDHLTLVADGNDVLPGAAGFASEFGASALGRLAGLWHDLGKCAPVFQDYLHESWAGRGRRGSVEHSTAGALLACRCCEGGAGLALAFVIAGHHAGLADMSSDDDSCLLRRLRRPCMERDSAIAHAPKDLLEQPAPDLPGWLMARIGSAPDSLCISIFIRMLFSCLIDADRLATEWFDDPAKAALRIQHTPSMQELRETLDAHLTNLSTGRAAHPSPVDVHRQTLLAACRAKATLSPGLFSLTAPTGSGKTFSSMAFALRHAELHGLRRVIYALPFTSVTEQNAKAFREALRACGDNVVLEHHSAYVPQSDDGDDPREVRRRMAVENWDAPVVVTTNVQLLESLFEAKASDCRKLHRIARSVIVLDEAQNLPVHLLKPTLAALEELATSYGTSIVLCSATMPAISWRDEFPIGLKEVREIVPEPEAMSQAMRRTQVQLVGPLEDQEVANRMVAMNQVLTIVNTRRHAAALFALVRQQSHHALHLSALMCPAHRSDRVREIKRRLAADEPCHVVSTQVVEAGVDIDFETVFRAMAGLDSIVQAAGRCNREGRRAGGQVLVFQTEEPPPPGIMDAIAWAEQVLGPGVDALGLETIEAYFRLHYWGRKGEWDGKARGDGRSIGVTRLLQADQLKFRAAADAYKIIDEHTVSVIVPYGDAGASLCEKLLQDPFVHRETLRHGQQFTVSVRKFTFDKMEGAGMCILTSSGVAVLLDASAYDENLGLRTGSVPGPTTLMA
ncbi:MAG: CRISPR-associated helicase Cas3' [Phycisphaeraceae bacterium]|nr:CRISPR-associated helicase Cas3' [Phycisphaeraceae bacterium]